MEVECLALKDLTSPRKGLSVRTEEEEDEGQTEQKENICTDRRRSTPLKSTESTVVPTLMNRRGSNCDVAHVTPIKHAVLAEPWTPTANLKMLISAASPDIRDREMKKVLFRPIENEKDQEKPASPDPVTEDTEVDDSSQFEAVDEEDEGVKKPSRKQKSLGLLCQKFLALYPDYPPADSPIWISLDEVASNLRVERRRIYDIVNVLESLMIVGRIAKNSYTWYGRQKLQATLEDLQRRGLQQGYHLQVEVAAAATKAGTVREDDVGESDTGNAAGNRKDKSLRIMSQKFVMLFLVSRSLTVTLDAAAKILIDDSQDSSSHSKYKTKVRRLYDIANVLTSLGLIKKVHVREEKGRKPAFRWLGPVEFTNPGNPAPASSIATEPTTEGAAGKVKMTRHSSFNITPTSAAVHRQVCSAPSSPRRERPDVHRRTTNNGAVCRLQFGTSSDSSGSSRQPPPTSPTSTLPTPSLQPEYLLPSTSSPHCVAYLPSLSQPSVVMLYGSFDQLPEGQRSPGLGCEEEVRKRKREETQEEEPGAVGKKRGTPSWEKYEKIISTPGGGPEECSHTDATIISTSHLEGRPKTLQQTFSDNQSRELLQPSPYLYVPNNSGLNSLNFFLPTNHCPAALAHPTSGVPTVALSYVLVPSAAISHYPLVASGQQPQGSDAPTKLSFSLPTVMSSTHLGAAPYSLASSDFGWSPLQSQSPPEPISQCGPALTSHSPPGPQQVYNSTAEPQTPHTPKDSAASFSRSFFQTPGTLEGGVNAATPAARKRGSVQRRLDVGHPPTD